MKRSTEWKYRALSFVFPFCLAFVTTLPAQRANDFRGQVARIERMGRYKPDEIAALRRFYTYLDYEPVWLDPSNRLLLESLYRLISWADYEGLEPDDYNLNTFTDYISHSISLPAATDSADLEVLFSMSAIRFFTHIDRGNEPPRLGYNGLASRPQDDSLPLLIARHVKQHSLMALPGKMTAPMKEIAFLSRKLRQMLERKESQAGWDPEINSVEVSRQNIPLMIKLYNLGLTPNAEKGFGDSTLTREIKAAQRLLNLREDGKMGKQTFQQLNIPVETRIRQLKLSINYFRWLSHMNKEQAVVVVNIPAARLTVVRSDTMVLSMRMIVGKPSTPTPTLSSTIAKLVLYPYWTVPRSIAVKELLPVFKRDPDYVRNGNFQVLDKRGNLVHAGAIRWSSYSASDFPFTIRQSTGCDNALGLLKLDFENPYGVYLHDTPLKLLFGSGSRFMSHGCMRMEKPMEMGRLLLGTDTRAIDTLTQKGCLKNQSPIIVPARVSMPVVVWYNTVGVDRSGDVIFYKDIYDKISSLIAKP